MGNHLPTGKLPRYVTNRPSNSAWPSRLRLAQPVPAKAGKRA